MTEISPRTLIREVQKDLDCQEPILEQFKQQDPQHVIRGFLQSGGKIESLKRNTFAHSASNIKVEEQSSARVAESSLLTRRRMQGIAAIDTQLHHGQKKTESTVCNEDENDDEKKTPPQSDKVRPLSVVKEYVINPMVHDDKADIIPVKSNLSLDYAVSKPVTYNSTELIDWRKRFNSFEIFLICLNLTTLVAIIASIIAIILFFTLYHIKQLKDMELLQYS